jgi:Zn-dependent oligopeptidase
VQCAKQDIECDGKIHMWDFRYYMRMAEEVKYAVDHNKLKDYFPLHVVTKGLLAIYQVCFKKNEKFFVCCMPMRIVLLCGNHFLFIIVR